MERESRHVARHGRAMHPTVGMAPGPDENAGQRNTLLQVASILLMVFGVVGAVTDLVLAIGLATAGASSIAPQVMRAGLPTDQMTLTVVATSAISVSLLCCTLQIWSGSRGLALRRGRGTAERCQTLGIVIAGTSSISWLFDRVIGGAVSYADVAVLVAQIVVPVLFYRAARREQGQDFWAGVKAHGRRVPAARPTASVADSFVIDQATGTVRPAAGGERACVEFLSLDEYERRESDSTVSRHLAHSARSIHHCAASTFEDSVYGTLLFPRETLTAGGMPFDDDVALAFNLERGHLTLVSDDPDAAGFVAYYLENQALVKHDASTVLFELCDLTIHDDMSYLIDVEDSLDRLEDNMSEDVNEVPQDFSDFVMHTRSELRVLESFYRQLSDVADDIAVSPAHVTSEQTNELFRVLGARSERLAADSRNLRDYALQIRSMYQGKIDVRQNRVMTVLTIVTTIFMPLTLLTSWYGMNFENMPELHNPYAYYVLIGVAVLVVMFEVLLFRRKRWF